MRLDQIRQALEVFPGALETSYGQAEAPQIISYMRGTDFADPDRSLAVIAPGNSGQPGSPFYDNLLEGWATERSFPLLYSRDAIENNTAMTIQLEPAADKSP